jgi:hypothetical protein
LPRAGTLTLDGAPVSGGAAAAPLRVEPGRHLVRIVQAGFEPFEAVVDVAADREVTVEVKLVPPPPPPPPPPQEPETPPQPGPQPSSGPRPQPEPQPRPEPQPEPEPEPEPQPQPQPQPASPSRAALTAVAPGEPSFRPGVLVGVLSFPRPIEIEASVRLGDQAALGFQYSQFPDLTLSGMALQFSGYQGIARWFPWQGAFYVGAGVGYQTLTAMKQDSGYTVRVDLSSPFVTPQLGWLWTWPSGLALGISLGVQIPFAGDPRLDVLGPTGAPVDESNLPEAARALRQDLDAAVEMVGQLPLPAIDLLKVGFYF